MTFTDLYKNLVSPFRFPSERSLMPVRRKFCGRFFSIILSLPERIQVSEVESPASVSRCCGHSNMYTPLCSWDDNIHVLNLIFDTTLMTSATPKILSDGRDIPQTAISSENLCSKYCPSHQIQNRTHPLKACAFSVRNRSVFLVRFRLNTAYPPPLIFHSFPAS